MVGTAPYGRSRIRAFFDSLRLRIHHVNESRVVADYRRYFVRGGSYFFTVVTHSRAKIFTDEKARTILGDQFRLCKARWPFTMDAVVVLPDHLHAIWSLPSGDDHYERRWGWIKKEFTKAWLAIGGIEQKVSESRRQRRDHGVWQPRFWEHTIRDEQDFDRHFDYIHYNPVKHGYVVCPGDWPASSFHRWVSNGVYSPRWGCAVEGRLDFSDLDDSTRE